MPLSVSQSKIPRCTSWQGYKRPLQLEDVFDLAPPDRAEEVAKEFDRRWDKQLQKKATGGKPSLVRATLCEHHALNVVSVAQNDVLSHANTFVTARDNLPGCLLHAL